MPAPKGRLVFTILKGEAHKFNAREGCPKLWIVNMDGKNGLIIDTAEFGKVSKIFVVKRRFLMDGDVGGDVVQTALDKHNRVKIQTVAWYIEPGAKDCFAVYCVKKTIGSQG